MDEIWCELRGFVETNTNIVAINEKRKDEVLDELTLDLYCELAKMCKVDRATSAD